MGALVFPSAVYREGAMECLAFNTSHIMLSNDAYSCIIEFDRMQCLRLNAGGLVAHARHNIPSEFSRLSHHTSWRLTMNLSITHLIHHHFPPTLPFLLCHISVHPFEDALLCSTSSGYAAPIVPASLQPGDRGCPVSPQCCSLATHCGTGCPAIPAT